MEHSTNRLLCKQVSFLRSKDQTEEKGNGGLVQMGENKQTEKKLPMSLHYTTLGAQGASLIQEPLIYLGWSLLSSSSFLSC